MNLASYSRSDRRALIIGISDYILTPLRYSGLDAIEVSQEISNFNYQFSNILLTEEDASKQAVRQAFKSLFQDADDGAILLFYFAGHGITIDGTSYLVTLDSEEDLEDGVTFQWLISTTEKLKTPNQVCIFILDCCHAGGFDAGNISLKLADIERHIGESSSGVVLLAATEEDDKALEDENLGHGLFTYWLCAALQGKCANNEGCITTSTLYDYVARTMEEKNYKQRIVFKTSIIGSAPVLETVRKR